MASAKFIVRRIKSAKNISQITRAMQMVAASKMRQAQEKAISGKPYSEKIYEVTRSLALKVDPKTHPLLKRPEGKLYPLIVLITTNKGLCGGLNTNLLRSLNKFLNERFAENIQIDFVTLGKKGQSFVLRFGGGYLADFSKMTPFTDAVGPIVKLITDQFLRGKYNQVWLVYNNFINALKQNPKIKQILPIASKELIKEELEKEEKIEVKEYLFEPSADEILNTLIPFYLEIQVREAILEAEASEHSARMIAMKNATDNALDLMDGLTLEYNKLRQQLITAEISDITTAKISMEVE